jgi:hypothetical protein
MTERSRIWTGDTGQGAPGDAGPYSAANWRDIWKYNGLYNIEGGVLTNSGTVPDEGLVVTQQSPLAAGVTVQPGRANVEGGWYENDANGNLTIAANASGNPRIDSIILRMDITAQTIRLAVLQGTPAATPVPPTLSRTAALWEVAIADVDVANGFATINNNNIFNRRMYHNVTNGLYHSNVQNVSGTTLRTGDVVVWSSGKTVTTSTLAGNPAVAGVWVGYTPNNGYGRVLYKGIGYVRVTGTMNQQIGIVQSNTAKIGRSQLWTGGGGASVFAYTLQATTFGASNGLALCVVDVETVIYRSGGYQALFANLGNATTISAVFVDMTLPGPNIVTLPTSIGGYGQLTPFISFSCMVSHSVANTRVDFDISVNGVDYAVTDLGCADGLTRAGITTAGVPYPVSWSGYLLGSSGFNQYGANNFVLRWKTPAATATVYNAAAVAGQDYPVTLSAFVLG